MRKPIAAFAAALSFCAIVQAADIQGRIDFDGTKDGIALAPAKPEGGGASNASWFKDNPEKNKQYVVSYFPSSIDWKKSAITVTPEKDGSITLQVKGAWDKDADAQTWTLIDGIQVEGAELKNGNFEDGAANWFLGGKEGSKASISDIAKSGSKSVKVSHNSPAYQNITVRAGQPVTVTFWHKSAE